MCDREKAEQHLLKVFLSYLIPYIRVFFHASVCMLWLRRSSTSLMISGVFACVFTMEVMLKKGQSK